MTTARILIVDDETRMRRVLEIMLGKMGYRTDGAANGREALQQIEQQLFDLIITDLRMPEMDGLALLHALHERGCEIPAIVVTAYGSVETAVDAMQHGASDYIIRPFDKQTVELAIKRALSFGQVQRQNRYLRDELDAGWADFIGNSAPMRALYATIQQVAPTGSTVLITGATGTGKELVARAIHQASNQEGLFVPLNCAAVPESMLESELFGHVRGAFTGAERDHAGQFEAADGGTLFLDEITEMPVHLQPKLLRALQEKRTERLGSNQAVDIDARIIAASNREPREAIDAGRLREDLYYRLNVFHIALPPLCERREDIPLLARHFAEKTAASSGLGEAGVSPAAQQQLLDYHWPGNVRELSNVIERAVILAQGSVIEPTHLPVELSATAPPGSTLPPSTDNLALPQQVETLERGLILAALERSAGNMAAAARLLHISERSLWYKVKKYAIRRPTA